MNLKHLFFFLFIFLGFYCQAQKTYFISTEDDEQSLIIDGQKWNGNAFFTVDSGKKLVPVIVSQDGYKNEYDILHENMHHTFTTTHMLNVDTNIISIIKPTQLDFLEEGFDFETHQLDNATFLKDLDHDGALQSYPKMVNEEMILQKLAPSNQYLTNEVNNYHNNTIGRYKFYSVGVLNSVKLYEITLGENQKFVQAYVELDWSITSKSMENLPKFNHKGKSGKFIITDETQEDTINQAVNDAILDALFYFYEEQELKLQKALQG